MMEDRILSWTASAHGKYVGGLLLIFTHCFRRFFCPSNYHQSVAARNGKFDHAGMVVAVFL
jgi:hypothetical protein